LCILIINWSGEPKWPSELDRLSESYFIFFPDNNWLSLIDFPVSSLGMLYRGSTKIKHADNYKVRANKSPRIGRRAKSECKRQVLSDDEGMDSDNELCAHSSHKTLGHTGESVTYVKNLSRPLNCLLICYHLDHFLIFALFLFFYLVFHILLDFHFLR
jgi:hypothetical protein